LAARTAWWFYSQVNAHCHALTWSGANSDNLSISARPSSWPFEMRMPCLCVPPWTLRRQRGKVDAPHTLCVTYLMSSLPREPDFESLSNNSGTSEASAVSQSPSACLTFNTTPVLSLFVHVLALALDLDLFALATDVAHPEVGDGLERVRLGGRDGVELALDGGGAAVDGEEVHGGAARLVRAKLSCVVEEVLDISSNPPRPTSQKPMAYGVPRRHR
jgi:hypothetical protein